MAKTNFIQNTLLDTGELVKRCKECGGHKPQDQFYRHQSGRLAGQYSAACKDCLSTRHKEWKKANPEKYRAGLRKRKYGMLEGEHTRLSSEQGGLCAICGQPETCKSNGGKERVLAVDHDHVSGAIRGLLCSRCNIGIAQFRDDVSILRAAISYLERHKKLQEDEAGA